MRGAALCLAVVVGCARAPSPLAPHLRGSVGFPHRGVLTDAKELPPSGPGYKWLRQDDRHFATERFVRAIARAAETVERERPGSLLAVGDLSVQGGGTLLPHFSHRNGRDADLLLYLTTLDGAPIESPGFIGVGRDGLAIDAKTGRFYRIDLEREWLLVRTLLEDDDARIQWIFVSKPLRTMLLQWGAARGESMDLLARAASVMKQPEGHAGVHDDHIHVRTECAPDETAGGCEHFGPERAWLRRPEPPNLEPDEELVLALLRPLPGDDAIASGVGISVDVAPTR